MTATSTNNRTKGIVAAVLGVLLVAVIFWDPSAAPPEPATDARPASQTVTSSATSTTKTGPQKLVTGSSRIADWPDVDLRNLEALNPFDKNDAGKKVDKAASVQAPQVEAPQVEPQVTPEERIKAFAGQRVRMICRTSKGVIGMIGTRTIREGDLIDGMRIVSIRTDGVIVEPAPASAPAETPADRSTNSEAHIMSPGMTTEIPFSDGAGKGH